MKYRYAFTGNLADSLFKSIPERHFEKMVEDQADFYYKESALKGDWREDFVECCLWDKLDGDDLDAIAEVNGLKGEPNATVKTWLFKNECPNVGEDDLRQKWASEKANDEASYGILWDHIDQKNDVSTALGMGYVKYPGFDKKKGCYIDGLKEGACIPAQTANRISEISNRMNALSDGYTTIGGKSIESSEHKKLRALMDRLERDAVEDLIIIDAYECGNCGCEVTFAKDYPINALPRCFGCDELLCDSCVDIDTRTEDACRAPFLAILNGEPEVTCRYCSVSDYDFLVSCFTAFGYPIPEEFRDKDQFLVALALTEAARKVEEIA